MVADHSEISELCRGEIVMKTKKKKIKGWRNNKMEVVATVNVNETPLDEIITNNQAKRYEIGKKIRVKTYDFKRPDKFSKDQIRTIQMIHETFARLSATSLSAQLRTLCSLHVWCVDQLTFEEFIRSIPNPTTLSVINMDPLKGSAIMEINPSIAFSIIDRVFGGDGSPINTNRELTDIELSVMENIIVRILNNLRESWSTVIDLKPRLGNIETNPQFAQIVPPNDMVVLVGFDIKVGNVESKMNLLFPYITIEPIIHKLSAQYWYSSIRKGEVSNETSAIQSLKANSEVFIETDQISLKNISQLRKNSLIKLPDYHKGEAFLLSGGKPVLSLKKPEKTKGNKMIFSIEDDRISEQDINIILPKKDTKKNEIEKYFQEPFQNLISHLNSSMGSINQKISEITDRQDALSEQLYSTAAAEEIPGDKIQEKQRGKPFSFIHKKDSDLLFTFLQGEHPQLIALVISYLEPNMTAYILSKFEEDLQINITERMATMDRTSPDVLREIERVLERKLNTLASNDYARAGGVSQVAEVLNLSTRSTERGIIEGLEKSNPDLAESIKRIMFVFEDIVLLDDKAVQKTLREVESKTLAAALKAVDNNVQNKIFRNMSAKAADMLKAEMAEMGPVRLRDVEAEQQRIVDIIRKLEENGEIIVARPDELTVE